MKSASKPPGPARALEVWEQKRRRIRRARLGRAGTLSLATVLSLAVIGLLGADQLFRPDIFSIEELSVRGVFRHVDPRSVEESVSQMVAGNFFAVDLHRVEQAAESIPWVRDARVRRDWPAGVSIEIDEHIPMMRWGADRWLTRNGDIVRLPGEIGISNPILLDGPDSSVELMLEKTIAWQESLEAIGLGLRQVSLTSWYAWRLVVQRGDGEEKHEFEILLGRDDADSRLARFTRVYQLHLDGVNPGLVRVDARYPNGMTITRAGSGATDESVDKA